MNRKQIEDIVQSELDEILGAKTSKPEWIGRALSRGKIRTKNADKNGFMYRAESVDKGRRGAWISIQATDRGNWRSTFYLAGKISYDSGDVDQAFDQAKERVEKKLWNKKWRK